jgi:hypothetical protein
MVPPPGRHDAKMKLERPFSNPTPTRQIDGASLGVGLRAHAWQPRYSTSRDDLVSAFYRPALEHAETYDRATGYFRSSFYDLTRQEVAEFALRGGLIRLVCSPDLAHDDVDAIERGADAAATADAALRAELVRILEHPHAASGTEILAALLAHGSLQLRLAFRPGAGIFHDKFGVFRDRHENRISFAGSINETWRAWHPLGNHESFEVFTSWSGDTDRVTDHEGLFDHLWASELDGVTVMEPSGDTLAVVRERASGGATEVLQHVADRPRRRGRTLLDHQRSALASWRKVGRRGIFKHATGSGKTVTALEGIRDHISDGQPALVIVPSTLLLHQWDREVRTELADLAPAILLAGGGASNWRPLLRAFTAPDGDSRVVIAVLDTASSSDFVRRVWSGEHLLVVGDEVHRMGADKAGHALTIGAGATRSLPAPHEPPAGWRRGSLRGPWLTPR